MNASDVHLGQLAELVAVGQQLDDLFQRQVHPRVAVDQLAVVGLAVLELDHDRLRLGRR